MSKNKLPGKSDNYSILHNTQVTQIRVADYILEHEQLFLKYYSQCHLKRKNFIREATKKNVKKFHNKCELSPKMENPPSPYFTTISATFGT